MATDCRINLAKELTSSTEERVRFYNRMLIYLVICAAGLVLVAFLSSWNLKNYIENNHEHAQLLNSSSIVSGLNPSAFKNPDNTYDELRNYSNQIIILKQELGSRVQLLPVVHNLFVDLHKNITLQSLSASKDKLAFGLIMPPPSAGADPVRDLRTAWEANEELMKRVSTIRPITGERRTIGKKSVFYVQFECILNK